MKNGRVALFLARRLQWKAEGRNKTSPSVGIAVTGVALSIIVMMISIAIVLGFKHEVSEKLMSLDDSITITAYSTDGDLTPINTAQVLSIIDLPHGATVIDHVETATILKTGDDFMAVGLRGSDSYVCPDSINSLALSAITANRLHITQGEKIPAYFFINNRLRVRALTVDSIYSTGIDEHDSSIGYCSPSLPRQLLGMDSNEASELGIRGVRRDLIETTAANIRSALLEAYYSGQTSSVYSVTTILQADAVYFTWLDLLDTNVVMILSLMAAVAAFTLISSLFIIILERVKTIGLLKSLGATNALIRRTFMLMTERLVVKGIVIGNVAAIALIVFEYVTHAIPLDSSNYYVDHVPVSISVWTIILLNAAVIAVSWIVLMIPALTIARISPASTMRYE